MPTPRYDVVNGVSELGAYAGGVDVVNGWGVTVARLPILEGGHLMTTALFGDDPATGAVEGLADGEHRTSRSAVRWRTNVGLWRSHGPQDVVAHLRRDRPAMGVPQPRFGRGDLPFLHRCRRASGVDLGRPRGPSSGRLLDANKGAGVHAETLALPALDAGTYTAQLRIAGEVVGTQRLVVVQ